MKKGNASTGLGWKQRVGIRLLEAAGVDRIHIIGCSRSGTTMLQYAMSAFAGAIIDNGEAPVERPYLRDRLRLFVRYLPSRGRHHLVTKRDYAWFHDDRVQTLIRHVRAEGVGLIRIVRDPRDVLTSRHSRAPWHGPYVTPAHWQASIRAGDRIFDELRDYPRKLEVRYEDVICSSSQVEGRLEEVFGLVKRPGVESIRNLRTNIETIGYEISDEMLAAMHRLRDMDESMVHRWARNHDADETFELSDDAVRKDYLRFMKERGYDSGQLPE